MKKIKILELSYGIFPKFDVKMKLSLLLCSVLMFQIHASGLNTKNDGALKLDMVIQKQLSGIVTNANNEPLPGASIVEKGTTNGTQTDFDGNFSILVGNENATLVVSYIGYGTQEINVSGSSNLNIVLEENLAGLDEVVVVGYSQQKKVNLTGSIAVLKAEELSKVPVSNVSNALAGQLPGLIAKQNSGAPGSDGSSLNIRGFGSALIVVDGVVTDFHDIDASQIESINILKDGASSIYGARAGNGVILVTTKRGKIGKPQITFDASYTLQKPTYFQDMLSSGDYTTLTSEAHLQSGQSEATVPYTPEQIQKYYAATEPGFYNTNWADQILRDYAPLQKYALSLRGGGEKFKYYTYLGALNQESFWKKNGGDYQRFNFQINLDAQITDNLSLAITTQNIVEDINSTHRPQTGGGYLFADLYNNKPMYPATLPDPTKIPYSGASTGGALVQSNRDLGGYSDDDFQKLNQSIALNYTIPGVDGLSVKVFGNYIQEAHQSKSFAKPVDLWTYNVGTEEYDLAAQFNGDTPLFQNKNNSRSLTGQFSASYNRIFNDVHDLNAMLLYEVYDFKTDFISARRSDFTYPNLDQLTQGNPDTMSNDGSAAELGRVSWVQRLNYAYDSKYLIDFIFRADASAKFPEKSRWGYFPSISAGWRISQENFMANLRNLNELKLRVSYGESGNDAIGDFQYLSGYTKTLMPVLWGQQPVMGITPTGLANTTLSWESLAITNFGLDYSLFGGKLYGEFDVFSRKRTGIPAYRTRTLPSSFGTELPLENLNSQTHKGFELQIGTRGSANKLKWDITGNIAYQQAKWDYFEEVEYTDPDAIKILKRSGKKIDETFGYRTHGLFTSQDQIDNLTFTYPGSPVLQLGDVHYVDTNGDGELDWRDQVNIGKSQLPNWTAGLNLNLSYSNFDFSALLQGAFDFHKVVHLGSFTQTFFDNRWTMENNNPNALLPRLGGAGTNGLLSDRNYVDSSYLRLKNFSLGYTFNGSFLESADIDKLRIYVAGTNLLTFSKLSKYDLDPESPFSLEDNQPTTSYYPQQKTIMMGLNLSF